MLFITIWGRARAHIFLCMLAYYVEWHMREAWASELMFADCDSQALATRDPVAPARRSEAGDEEGGQATRWTMAPQCIAGTP